MKKALVLLAALVLIASAAAAEVDLSGMSFDELVELAHQVDQAIWASDGWQEVTVPPGTYRIGEDIPEGKWTVRPAEGCRVDFYYCKEVDAVGSPVTGFNSQYLYENLFSESFVTSYDNNNPARQISIPAFKGLYIVIKSGNAVFSPYVKASLGFK